MLRDRSTLSKVQREEGGTTGKEKANSPSRTGSRANGMPLKKPPCSERAPQRGLLSSTVARLGFNLLSPPVPLHTHMRRHATANTQFHNTSSLLCSPTVSTPSCPLKYTVIISLATGHTHHQQCHNHHPLYCCKASNFSPGKDVHW